jgi:hypothetical protein
MTTSCLPSKDHAKCNSFSPIKFVKGLISPFPSIGIVQIFAPPFRVSLKAMARPSGVQRKDSVADGGSVKVLIGAPPPGEMMEILRSQFCFSSP